MPTAYLGLGSNVGDPPANLIRAIGILEERGLAIERVSSGYLTQPVGEILDQPDFLNAVIAVGNGFPAWEELRRVVPRERVEGAAREPVFRLVALAAGVPVFPCPGFPFMEMLSDE